MEVSNISKTAGNLTAGNDLKPVWNAVCIIETFITVTAPCLIVPSLFVLIREKNLHTPFNVYIVNLLISDFLWFAFLNPLDIINSLYSNWILSGNACTFYICFLWIIGTGQPFCHVLISANRFWAVTFINSYKRKHSIGLAVLLCVSGWIISSVINLPVVILDARYYRLPLENNTCQINSEPPQQKIGIIVIQFVCCTLEFIVLCACPYIWYKRTTRRHIGQQRATMNHTAENVTVGAKTEQIAQRSKKRESNSFLILTILTVMVLLFWTPQTVYYTMLPFLDSFDPTLASILWLMFQLQLLSDPILFCITIKDLRESMFRKIFRMK